MSAPVNVGSSGNPAETGEGVLSGEIIRPKGAYQPLVPFDPNIDFQFNTSERCERYFEWSNWSTTDVSFETPSFYDSAFTNISFRVRNVTSEILFDAEIGTDTTKSKTLAQGFNITQYVALSGFSIYVTGKAATPVTLLIREETAGGPILYTFSVTLPDTGTSHHWFNVTCDSSVFLSAGHYYLTCSPVGNSGSQWLHTGTGTYYGDTFENGVAVLYNMTLKVQAKKAIDPETVNMQVSNQPVQNLANGLGWANLTSVITGGTKSFPVYYSSPIEYSFSSHLIFYRASKCTNVVNLTNGQANWTLTAFAYPGSNYTVYQGNITGFNKNYPYVQGFFGQDPVGCWWPAPYDTLIFDTAVDKIRFTSPNYITGSEIPSQVYSNQDIDLNVTVGDIGNLSVFIYTDAGSIYSNTSYNSGTNSFRWHVDTGLPAGEYTCETVFFMANQVGFLRQNITLVRVAAIDACALRVQALDLLQLNCRLFDPFADSNIEEANINYHFTDLSGSLQYGIDGNYTKDLDLKTYSIRPGSYQLYLQADKAGFQPLLVTMPVEILPREIDLEIERSATNLIPGSTLEITINPHDRLTGGNLLRPVDVTIKIYPTGGDPDVDAVVTWTLRSITKIRTQTINIPMSVNIAAYDILVRVKSEFYSGNIVIREGLVMSEPPNIAITTLIVLGVGIVGSGSYIQRKKAQARRSVKGAFIMNPGGTLIEQRISTQFSTMNPHLISGAVMGIVTMVREMTGGAVHTIALEGRYLKFLLRDSFWVVLLMENNPAWISGNIMKLLNNIEQKYGAEIKAWKGEANLHIPLDDLLRRWFGVEIKEAREPDLELESRAIKTEPSHDKDLEKKNQAGA